MKGFNGREIDELADMWLAVREGVAECKLTIRRGEEDVEVEIDPAALRRSWR